jgi:hypothetical protein
MSQENWTSIPVIQYLKQESELKFTGLVTMDISFGNQIRRFPIHILVGIFSVTSTQTRECIISSCSEWNDFISDSLYSLYLEPPDKSWEDMDAKNVAFKKWMLTKNIRNEPNYQKLDEKKFREDNTLVTVLDTAKGKRLIVDGMHRAAALTMACEDGSNIPQVRIIECAGSQVNVIFPCNVHQLP